MAQTGDKDHPELEAVQMIAQQRYEYIDQACRINEAKWWRLWCNVPYGRHAGALSPWADDDDDDEHNDDYWQ